MVSDAIWDFQIVSQRWTRFEFWGSFAAFRPLRVCLTFSSIFRPFGDLHCFMCKKFGSEIELFEYFRPFPAFYTHLGFRPRFAASKTFWVFDIVSSNEGVLCFWGLLWCLDHYVCYDPYGHFKPFLVFWGLLRCLDHYMYNWPLRIFLPFWVFEFVCGIYTITCMFDLHDYLDHFVFLTSFRV